MPDIPVWQWDETLDKANQQVLKAIRFDANEGSTQLEAINPADVERRLKNAEIFGVREGNHFQITHRSRDIRDFHGLLRKLLSNGLISEPVFEWIAKDLQHRYKEISQSKNGDRAL